MAYHSDNLAFDLNTPGGLATETFDFQATSQSTTSWPPMSILDSTTPGAFQLPPAMKDASSKATRFASTVAGTKLPQVVTTSYNDTSVGSSSLIGVGTSASSSTMGTHKSGRSEHTTSSHKHGSLGSLGSRRGSNVSSRGNNGSTSPYDPTVTSPNRKASHASSKHGRGSHSGSGSGSKGGSDDKSRSKFACTRADCHGPVFTRMADLDRHMLHIHTDADKKERFLCDYSSCSRSATPFHRKDHYREHLRVYHLEDLLKRGSNANHHTAASTSSSSGARTSERLSPSSASASASSTADVKRNKKLLQETQLQHCKTEAEWWRCARCLQRVDIAERGWTCPNCKGSIEEPRKAIRMSRSAASMAATNARQLAQSLDMPAEWGTYSDMSMESY
ncbi:uncharacterized protein SPSK_09425 [Sporothrix schenckii 1099-18]|nr:uncharacterized protein SPSK_09425 [Sporothrix schenckii 1099-18]KJR84605.1 hypothetical protein SPSK_09425 [Sporothrix schenckii 1099-18]